MPDGKTIRQIADEIGVTRQAIYKKFKFNSAVANSIKIHSFKVDRVKYYTAEGEKIIKSMFADNSNTSQSTVNLSTEQLTDKLTHDNLTTNQVDRLSEGVNLSTNPVYTPVNEFTVNLTDLFTAQLTEKDHQIAEKDKQLSEKDKQIAEKDKQLVEKDNQIAQLTAMLQKAQEQQVALVQTLAAEQALHAGSIQKQLSEIVTENVIEKKHEEKSTQNFFSRFFKKNK